MFSEGESCTLSLVVKTYRSRFQKIIEVGILDLLDYLGVQQVLGSSFETTAGYH